MGPLARAFRPSGLTLGWPPFSFLPSLGDVVPLVPILISSPRVLGKRAWIILTRSSCFGKVVECSI
jgi:hypothetical protein